ncbi:two-component regulator propeller domain-containing protein [Reichenbachiella ulvae]|uniref:Methyl-accepting chemotaxis protein n=1 Tax=Reichenbachiella ulvae TaxID=2980104 RepID=A0ABT3CPU5_9BACT|nr:two-component regulator propeller domain-containing protein [Reichenbachiella ulvae]MCV9385743.1 methyl-accepting chemotaxis protein [Reichenbachiella ulvae]
MKAAFLTQILIGLTLCSVAQGIVQNQYEFKSITVDNGLSNNHVGAITQDQNGFIWFATDNGIDRYDGQTIVPYRHNPDDSTSLSSKTNRELFSDSRGNLWIGNSEGLDLYNPSIDGFIHFDRDSIKVNMGRVNAIKEDKNQLLWIASNNSLYTYNLINKECKNIIESNPDIFANTPTGNITKLDIDKKGNIWFSVYKKGIYLFDPDGKTVRGFTHDKNDPTTLSGNQIEHIYEDNSGNMWFGTMNNGLNQFDFNTNSFKRIIPDPDNSYTTRVRAIFEDLKGDFFVGTRGGLFKKHESSDEFYEYATSDHKFSKLSQNSILCSFIDQTGSLWIGTYAGGVSCCDLKKKNFVCYTADSKDNYFLNSPNVYGIAEDDFGNVWVGTDNGVNVLDRQTSKFRVFTHDSDDQNTISYNDSKCLANAGNGDMWIGTNRGGLNFYDFSNNSFTAYSANDNKSGTLTTDKIYGLLYDRNKNLWVFNGSGTGSIGYLDMLPNGSDEFIHMSDQAYFGMLEAKDGSIWIGSDNGILFKSNDSDTFEKIENESIDFVYCIEEDSKSTIWLGTNNGILNYDRNTGNFTHYNQIGGHKLRVVYGIKEDQSGNLWASTEEGLLFLRDLISDPENASLTLFDQSDGLQSKQFNYNSYFSNSSGELMFGGINGFNIFNPNEINLNNTPPKLAFTDLKVFNKSVKVGKEVNGKILLKESIADTEKLTFYHQHNLITIEFAALHFAKPTANTYRYKMQGLNDEWVETSSSRNFATYNNLPPGDYTFLVNASNLDGVWAEEPIKIDIEVIPAFWAKWWFRTILVIIIILSALWFYRRRINQQKRSQKLLNIKINQATNKVNAQNEELQDQSKKLKEAIEETNNVVQEALESGNFNARISLEAKTGAWRDLALSINQLFDSITTPFNIINHLINQMAEGNLTERFEVEAKGDILRLKNNLNKAMDNLTELVGDINDRSSSLKVSSEDMLVTSEQMKVSTEEIANAIGEIARGAQDQVSKIDESSNLIEGVMNSANEMGTRADDISNTAKLGVEKSDTGMRLMEKLNATMSKILSFSENANEAVTNLNVRSQEISSVLRIIKDVASQTNLLALNAAIEAAQAGEAGRGFAVVAEEIRKLAEDSKKSAASIEELVNTVQADTKSTVEIIHEMNESIKDGEEATGVSMAAFKEIYAYYEETSLKSDRIVKDTHQQTEDINQVVKLISSVVVIAEETASAAEETASSSSELSAGMINYRQKSEDISKTTDLLKQKVEQFKLNKQQDTNPLIDVERFYN